LLLQAQASKAKIIGLAIGGGDTINAIKQAGEFNIVAGGQNLAAIVMFIDRMASSWELICLHAYSTRPAPKQ
jgi:branched-chain amino acid transport system substrate-binding protein